MCLHVIGNVHHGTCVPAMQIVSTLNVQSLQRPKWCIMALISMVINLYRDSLTVSLSVMPGSKLYPRNRPVPTEGFEGRHPCVCVWKFVLARLKKRRRKWWKWPNVSLKITSIWRYLANIAMCNVHAVLWEARTIQQASPMRLFFVHIKLHY